MFSQNVAKVTAPSYTMIRSNLPDRKPQNQWEGVYYFSGITKRQQHVVLLHRKQQRIAAIKAFNTSCNNLRTQFDMLASVEPTLITTSQMQYANASKDNISKSLLKLEGDMSNADKVQTTSNHAWSPAMRFELACKLARHGLHIEANELFTHLHHHRLLHIGHYIEFIAALSAEQLHTRILHSDAMGDPALTFKLMGDENGEERASLAYYWYETAMSLINAELLSTSLTTQSLLEEQQLNLLGSITTATSNSKNFSSINNQGIARALQPTEATSAMALARKLENPSTYTPHTKTSAATQLVNSLMHTLLTCGYYHVKAISDQVYDRIGLHSISPTMRTYEYVTLSLSLQGNMAEAESVMRYLRHHHGAHLSIHGYNALLLGHRECKAFDRCDQLWQELVDSRWPRPTVLTAELYLRSVIDHSYTPLSAPMQRFGNVNVVEKKKIPIILAQLNELGIPRTHFSLPLHDEIEDALRKFSIYKSRFYEWGRAVKQFNFIEFRRRQGWIYDLDLMRVTTKVDSNTRTSYGDASSMMHVAMAELPSFFSDRLPWDSEPLADLRFTTNREERVDDVRAGDIYYDDKHNIHERSANWMNEVPETRYDQLYGVNNPDVAKIGIRRHLDLEYVNRKEVIEKDAALLRRAISQGRRLRRKVETTRTHRTEGSLVERQRR